MTRSRDHRCSLFFFAIVSAASLPILSILNRISAVFHLSLDCGTGFLDPPIVDSTTENVYAFIGSGCDVQSATNPNAPGNSYINRFGAGTSISSSYGPNAVSFGNASANDHNTIGRHGAFDNLYYAGSTSGNVYACVNGRIYQIPTASLNGTGSTVHIFSTPVSVNNSTSPRSPLTEFRGASAATTLTAPLGTTGNPAVASTTEWP